jgi:DNA-binding CsgD family transcriptional regulator
VERLTNKQIEIAIMLSKGMTAEEIARERCRSVHTVRTHIYNAMGKLGCLTVAHLVYQAIKHGYIPL